MKPDAWLAISGLVGQEDLHLLDTDFEGQLRQALKNTAVVLQAHGGTLDNLVKTTVYLVGDMTNFRVMNEVWMEFFGSSLDRVDLG